jgi:hypothetical protein
VSPRAWWKVGAPAAAVAAAAWAGLAWIPSDPPASGPVDLVTLAPTDESALRGAQHATGRRWVARRDASSGARVLTNAFFRAEAPSPSFDGRWFVFAGRREASSAPAIHRMSLDGSAVREITRGAGEPGEPIVMPGGGIVFTDRAEGPAGTRALFACAEDGSELRRLTFGPHRDASPALLEDGRLRFDRFLRDTGGNESRLTMTIRPDGTGLARSLGSAPAVAASASDAPHGRWGIIPASAGGASDRRELAAVPAAPRPEPPVLTSVVSAARATGTLLCLDVHASRLPAIADLPRGSIAAVKVTRAGGEGAGEVIAEAPVQPDGSFLVEVPADTLVGLTLVGRDGAPLASFHSGVWVRPNENRGCVGCHEPSDRAPANRRPMAVDAASPAYPAGAMKVSE